MNKVEFDNNGYIADAEYGGLSELSDVQVRMLAYQFARELAHRHDALFDTAQMQLDRTFYYSERVARYLLDPDINTPSRLKDQLEECEINSVEVYEALHKIDEVFNY